MQQIQGTPAFESLRKETMQKQMRSIPKQNPGGVIMGDAADDAKEREGN